MLQLLVPQMPACGCPVVEVGALWGVFRTRSQRPRGTESRVPAVHRAPLTAVRPFSARLVSSPMVAGLTPPQTTSSHVLTSDQLWEGQELREARLMCNSVTHKT